MTTKTKTAKVYQLSGRSRQRLSEAYCTWQGAEQAAQGAKAHADRLRLHYQETLNTIREALGIDPAVPLNIDLASGTITLEDTKPSANGS